MRARAWIVVLSTAVLTVGCDRASASDDELGAQLKDSTAAAERASLAKPAPARQTAAAPAPAPQTREVTQTHVKRDAAIGAGVGAVAGAVANGDNRVKGGVVGAVVGGAAGAIVGKTIDKQKKTVPR